MRINPIQRLVLALFLLHVSCWAGAQSAIENAPGNITIQFLSDSVALKPDHFHFNSLRVKNKSAQKHTLSAKAIYPGFINLLSAIDSVIELPASGEVFIPLRFTASTHGTVNTAFSFSLEVTVNETGESLRASFPLRVTPYYRWRLALVQSDITLNDQMNTTGSKVRIENSGNVTDHYQFSFDLPEGIHVARKMEPLALEPGEWREVEVPLALTPVDMKARSDMNIYIRNAAGEKRMLIQKFVKIGHVFTQNVYKWERMPLTLELNLRNPFTDRMLVNASARGSIQFSRESGLDLFVMSKNYYKGLQVNNDQGMIRYHNARSVIAAGFLTDFEYFTAYGPGVHASYQTSKKGSSVKSSIIHSKIYNSTTYNAGVHQVLGKRVDLHSTLYYYDDRMQRSNSIMNVSRLDWQPRKGTKIEFKGGAGTTHHNGLKSGADTTLPGTMSGYSIEQEVGKWELVSRMDVFGKNFPGINKGFNRHQHEVRRIFKDGNISAQYNADKRVYNQSFDSSIKSFFITDSKEYMVRGNYNKSGFFISPGIGIFEQQQDSANSFRSSMTRFSLVSSLNIAKDLNIMFSGNAGVVKVSPGGLYKPKFAFTSLLSLQYKFAGVQLQYDRNPYFYYEIKQQLQSGNELKRMQLMPYLDYTFKKWDLNYRVQYFYINDKLNDYKLDYITNQLSYRFPKLGLSAILSSTISTTQKQNQFTNIVLQKSIAAPFYKKNKSYSFRVVLFRDRNNNNEFNAGEDELLPHADILVDGLWLRTGADGAISFKNVGTGFTEIDFSRINARGWIPRDGLKQKFDHSKAGKKIMIAFKESRTIKGRLTMVADERSEKRMTLNNIRITATDEKGATFHTLTDNNEEFFFDLPAGRFTVSINQEAFDVDFIPTETVKLIDLTVSSSEEITFEIRQRKRKVNIKSDDDDDDEEEEEEE